MTFFTYIDLNGITQNFATKEKVAERLKNVETKINWYEDRIQNPYENDDVNEFIKYLGKLKYDENKLKEKLNSAGGKRRRRTKRRTRRHRRKSFFRRH